MSEWKSIHSAPINTKILCCNVNKGWTMIGEYVFEIREWSYPADQHRSYLGQEPTHWMELPSLPKIAPKRLEPRFMVDGKEIAVRKISMEPEPKGIKVISYNYVERGKHITAVIGGYEYVFEVTCCNPIMPDYDKIMEPVVYDLNVMYVK